MAGGTVLGSAFETLDEDDVSYQLTSDDDDDEDENEVDDDDGANASLVASPEKEARASDSSDRTSSGTVVINILDAAAPSLPLTFFVAPWFPTSLE